MKQNKGILRVFRLLLALTLLLPLAAMTSDQSSEARDELAAIVKAYTAVENFSVDLSIRLYDSYSAGSASEDYKGHISYSKDQYYSELDEVTVLNNRRMNLMIDGEDKVMIINRPEKNLVKKNVLYNIDSSMKLYKKIEVKAINSELSQVELTPVGGQYSKIKIEYSSHSHFIQALVLYLARPIDDEKGAQAPRIEIRYSNISTNAFSKEAFSESRFIRTAKGHYVPAAAFANYKLHNYLK